MTSKKTLFDIAIVAAVVVAGFIAYVSMPAKNAEQLDATPQNVTLSGTYTCLPHLNTSGPQTLECAFGLKTDDGVYYAINFGASAGAMEQFQSAAHITAEGFVVPKEALSTDQWAKYNMKGIFTVTRVLDPAPTPAASLNLDGTAI